MTTTDVDLERKPLPLAAWEAAVFCILSVPTGEVLYHGYSVEEANRSWQPGTCHGVGRTRFEAWLAAVDARRRMLAAKRR